MGFCQRDWTGALLSWRGEHVQWLGLRGGSHFAGILSTFRMVASGEMPQQVAAILGACSLIALVKPDSGVRPIAVGEVIRRVVALCIQYRSTLEKFFQPLQYGVNTRGGCEMIAHTVIAHLERHPDHVVAKMDCKR